jgi:hypothetical protein
MRMGTDGYGRNRIFRDPQLYQVFQHVFSYIVVSNRGKCQWSKFVNLVHSSEHSFSKSLRIQGKSTKSTELDLLVQEDDCTAPMHASLARLQTRMTDDAS